MSGQRLGEPFEADTKDRARRLCASLHGLACVKVQSLVSWEEEVRERQAEERNRRLFPRLSEEYP